MWKAELKKTEASHTWMRRHRKQSNAVLVLHPRRTPSTSEHCNESFDETNEVNLILNCTLEVRKSSHSGAGDISKGCGGRALHSARSCFWETESWECGGVAGSCTIIGARIVEEEKVEGRL